MGKIIIDNQSDLDDVAALQLITSVVSWGRESNNGKQYCYLSRHHLNNSTYQVGSFLNKKSDRFVIIKES